MRVIPPVEVTPAKLVSSTAAATHDPAEYSSGTTYGVGAIVKVTADYAIYESLQGSNSGNTPATSRLWWRKIGATEDAYNAGTTYSAAATVAFNNRCYESLQDSNTGNTPPIFPERQTEWWLDVGPVNRWAMFDLSRNTQTVVNGDLTVVFAPGERVNAIGITGMKANTVTITVTSVLGGGTVYGPLIIDLNTREVSDGYDFCFEPFSTLPSAVRFNLPPFSDAQITVTFSSNTGNTKCGAIVVGNGVYLGSLEYQATNAALNFSTIERDLYGTATLVQRRSLPKTTNTLYLPTARVNKAIAARTQLNAVPAFWAGLDETSNGYFEMTLILGIYTRFEINADSINQAKISLDLEEL